MNCWRSFYKVWAIRKTRTARTASRSADRAVTAKSNCPAALLISISSRPYSRSSSSATSCTRTRSLLKSQWCCQILVDQAARDRGRKQHSRDTRARMCSGSHQIEALNLAGTVMRAEIGRLKERWLDGERRAEITLKLRLKIQRREAAFPDRK